MDNVCDAICSALEYEIPKLTEKNQFVNIANDFHSLWNFPNVVGAIDGRHCAIKCPNNGGSMFFNYKGFHSIVLMAVSDAKYKFIYLDIGAYGSEGDANIFASTKFAQSVLKDTLNFPEDTTVLNEKLSYFFVADDAFPLTKRIMKPYKPKRGEMLSEAETIFNYRLSRARRCVENSFGILCSKWLCLARTMLCAPDRAQKIIKTCCYLHNHLLELNKESYCPAKYVDRYDNNGKLIEGEWRKSPSLHANNSLFSNKISSYQGRPNEMGKSIRDILKNYVNSVRGSVPWQRKAVFLNN